MDPLYTLPSQQKKKHALAIKLVALGTNIHQTLSALPGGLPEHITADSPPRPTLPVCLRPESLSSFHDIAQRITLVDSLFQLFLKNGDSIINLEDSHGATPIHYAALTDNIGVFKKLVELGADMNAETKIGKAAFHGAASMSSKKILAYLLELSVCSFSVMFYGFFICFTQVFPFVPLFITADIIYCDLPPMMFIQIIPHEIAGQAVSLNLGSFSCF